MKDFIDRLAARAVGGESMLSPRLPSVFEPQRPLQLGLAEEVREVEAPAPREATTMQPRVGTQREAPARPASAGVQAVTKVTTSATPERQALRRNGAHAAPVPVTPAERLKVTESDLSRSTYSPLVRARAERAIPPVPLQRERMVDVLSATEGRKATDEGTLLTPAQRVFRTSPAPVTAPAGRFPVGHHAQALAASATPEPVVHVSIGRLEVRATPSTGKATAPRQDAPRSSPLDDYLRQRGKASP